jgi:hypothetical protein
MKCPLCGKSVSKVSELTEEDCNVESSCSSEYYIHKGKKLIKIIDPSTPTDMDRKKYE